MSEEESSGESRSNDGREMMALAKRLQPICRSITGNGVRETLDILRERIPLLVREVESGTQVFDWEIPNEWNIRDAWVKDPKGTKVIDLKVSNLHILNYSEAVHAKMSLAELKKRLYSLPDQPDAIPYRTSYYKKTWGFCLKHSVLEALEDGEYEVFIDATLEKGSLSYGEFFVEGESEDEVLVSTHCCHPTLANDNLSGLCLATFLAQRISSAPKPKLSYRFLFLPGTIGSIAWLALNRDRAHRIKHGLVAACVGDRGHLTYKRSRQESALVDRATEHYLRTSGSPFEIMDFSPYGYDERQYCSPGFNLAVGSLTRTPHGKFAEYHTSLDDLDFIDTDSLQDSLDAYEGIFEILENDTKYLNTKPFCEPQLGKLGLYSTTGGQQHTKAFQLALLWVLNASDGTQSLLEIAVRSQTRFSVILKAARALRYVGLLELVE